MQNGTSSNFRNWMFILSFQIALGLILCGCGSQASKAIRDTKNHSRSVDVRNVVTPLFSQYVNRGRNPTNADFEFVVPANKIPEEIKSLPLFTMFPKDEVVIISTWEGTNGDALLFTTGSGFGHWGLLVCKDPHDREFDKLPAFSYWQDGIYFYNGE